ncbi:MAG: VOC family protein [Alphaproteobacteria bacterium]
MGLKLSHAFINVVDVNKVVPFYTDILGFQITDRGHINGEIEAVFMSQDTDNHHQIALAGTLKDNNGLRNLGHVAFRMEKLDDLRALKKRLTSEGIAIGRELSHGNAWSLYFTDPEGNGVECFVDTPFHVSQPQGKPTDIELDDAELLDKTRDDFHQEPEFGPYADWQEAMRRKLAD